MFLANFTLNCLLFPPDKSSSRFFTIFLQIFFFSPLVSRQVGFFAIFTLYFLLFPPGKSSSRFFCQYYPLFCNMRGAFLGRGGGFYFVRLEKKIPTWVNLAGQLQVGQHLILRGKFVKIMALIQAINLLY